MKKNLLKIGALALGMFAFGLMFNGSSSAETGEVTLTINTGVSQCVYATSIDLGSKTVQFDAYKFTGDFTSEFSCTDLVGGTGGWAFYMIADDLNNTTNGVSVIHSGNIYIKHAVGVLTGDTSCGRGSATVTRTLLNTSYTLIERVTTTPDTCQVTIPTVSLEVEIAENTAPGTYVGDLTLTIPSF